jgi:hypothetical protein
MIEKKNDFELLKEERQEKQFYAKPQFDAVQLIADQTMGGCSLLSGSSCDPFSLNS